MNALQSVRTLSSIAAALAALAGCADDVESTADATIQTVSDGLDSASLPAAETFTWGSQPISVSPPPEDWYRDRANSGGLRGVRFIKSRGFGEEIRIAEHYALDERLRCGEQMALLDELDGLSRNEFAGRLQRARLHVRDPINLFEERAAETANAALDEASARFRADDIPGTRRAIRQAIDRARGIRYQLTEVVDRVMFDEASYDSFGNVQTMAPVNGYVGGMPSISVDYTLDSTDNGHQYRGRQVYVLENNRLFVLSYHGLLRNLPVFEAILDSVSFPRSLCQI